MEQLLTTKLFITATRPELVPRLHLIEKLGEGLHRKLTLISAPAGFGKTTLVTEWVDTLHLNTPQENQIKKKSLGSHSMKTTMTRHASWSI